MTVFAWARKRDFPALPTAERRLFRVSDDTEVLAHCFWQRDRANRPVLVALHGLEGSSEAHYMRGLADKAWRRGWSAVLLNQRNCGGTESLTPGLYHSGLTDDPRLVIKEIVQTDGIRAVAVAGYSLGGNLTLKLAGELPDQPLPVVGVAAVSPTSDLDLCVRALERRSNFPYQWNFVRHLKARMRRKAEHWPAQFDLSPLGRIWTIRQFDEQYTAPFHKFKNASDYYFRASSLRVIDRIPVPAMIISAGDDPFVPSDQFRNRAITDNANIVVRIEERGGHCGFVAEASQQDDGYWAETTAIEFLAAAMPPEFRAP